MKKAEEGLARMKLPRRQFLHLAAGAAALPAVLHVAWAQAYPMRPVRLVVPAPAGGSFDITARLMGQWLSERLGQPFAIENLPVPAPISARRRSCVRPPTAIRCSWSARRTACARKPSRPCHWHGC